MSSRNRDQLARRIGTTAVLLAAIALLVGISSPPALATPTYDWDATDCTAVIVIVPTSPEIIQPHVPDGFTPVIPPSVRDMLPPDPRLEAAFGYEVFDCATETIDGRTATDVTYASIWTFVEPPDRLADPDYPFAFYKWLTLVDDDEQRAVLERHGAPVTDGTRDMQQVTITPAGATYDATMTLDDDASYRTTGAGNNPIESFEGNLIEYSALEDRPGYVLWRTRYSAPTAFGGTGVASWDQDALATEILGTTEAQAYILAADGFELSDGSITIAANNDDQRASGDNRPDTAPPDDSTTDQHPEAHPTADETVQAATSLPATGGGAGVAATVLLACTGVLVHTRRRG